MQAPDLPHHQFQAQFSERNSKIGAMFLNKELTTTFEWPWNVAMMAALSSVTSILSLKISTSVSSTVVGTCLEQCWKDMEVAEDSMKQKGLELFKIIELSSVVSHSSLVSAICVAHFDTQVVLAEVDQYQKH